ncbi:MAG: hypothetical protein KF819_11995 [Labilithrix sp.]|nr:hypothetical protein [Labilithrix sp.]
MKTMPVALGALGALALAAAPAIANADEWPKLDEDTTDDVEENVRWFARTKPAPSRAFELGAATGYTQGFGLARAGVEMGSIAAEGIGAELAAGYRVDPHWSFGVAGQFYEVIPERAAGARGLTGTLGVQYHFKPETTFDPWVELGLGYRGLWETQSPEQPAIDRQALQVARVRLGADYRITESVSLGPFIGLDANVFVTENGAPVDDPRLSTFVMAGMIGRFDLGGERKRTKEPDWMPDYSRAQR